MKWRNGAVRGFKWITRSLLGIYLLCFLFTLIMLYNHIFPLNGMVRDRDYVIQLWNLWQVNEAVTSGQNPFTTDLIFYPVGANLARYNLSPGFFPVTFLVKNLSGGDVQYPIYTRRLLNLFAFSLILCFSYLTLRALGLSRWASVIPAVAYTFSDYYMHHINQGLNHISGFFIPISAFMAIRLFKDPKMSTALILAFILAVALYFTESVLYIYMALLFLGGALLINPSWRAIILAKLNVLGLRAILMALLVFFLVAAPFLLSWFASEAEPPRAGDAFRYSSNLAGLFVPDPRTTRLYGNLFAGLDEQITVGIAGNEAFVGFTLLIFGVVGLLTTRQRIIQVLALVALLFFVLSLGPALKIFSLDIEVLMPYSLLASAPIFRVGRAPVRFVVMALFLWMIVAAFGLHWFQAKVTQKYGQQWASGLMIAIFLWTTVEVYSPFPSQEPYIVPPQLESMVEGPAINLPLKLNNGWALLPQMFHHQPLATGEISRQSRRQKEHFETLRNYYAEALRTGSCHQFVAMGYRNIIIWDGVPDDVVLGLSQSPNCSLNIVDLRN